MEVVLAIAIVALTIPLIFGVMGASSGSRKQSRVETHGPFIARGLMDDVQRGWRAEGYFFEGELPSPHFGEEGDERIFGFDSEGLFVRRLSAAEDGAGVGDGGIVYVAKVRGEAPDTGTFLAGETDAAEASLVTVRIESPAIAKPPERKSMVYQTLKVPAR